MVPTFNQLEFETWGELEGCNRFNSLVSATTIKGRAAPETL